MMKLFGLLSLVLLTGCVTNNGRSPEPALPPLGVYNTGGYQQSFRSAPYTSHTVAPLAGTAQTRIAPPAVGGNQAGVSAPYPGRPVIYDSQSVGRFGNVNASYQPGGSPSAGFSNRVAPGVSQNTHFNVKGGYTGTGVAAQTPAGGVGAGYQPGKGPTLSLPFGLGELLKSKNS